ncbi:MAG: acyl-ACP--UDP-N-acetylglucosamine O-acyltransferase [Rhodospirillales bacterium]|nr:acyl-ACP--UDP-N-acetylglucosamine O-acyltransferase [Rhodospirillales bacterium]
MTQIHPTAIIADGAQLGENVSVGAYCCVGPQVVLDDGVQLHSHVVVDGRTRVGANTRIFPFASIGHIPQDLKYKGEASELVIGRDNTIREHVTMNPGTEGGGMLTEVGNHCLFMVGAHVAHDCRIGDHVIFVNNATLGGHVEVGDWAILGGLSAVHQFVRIGKHAMIGGMSGIEADVIPYGAVIGNRARLSGLNIVGLKRRGFSREVIHALRNAYRLLFAQEGTMIERLDDVAQVFSDNEPVMEIVGFIRAASSRALCQPALEDAA